MAKKPKKKILIKRRSDPRMRSNNSIRARIARNRAAIGNVGSEMENDSSTNSATVKVGSAMENDSSTNSANAQVARNPGATVAVGSAMENDDISTDGSSIEEIEEKEDPTNDYADFPGPYYIVDSNEPDAYARQIFRFLSRER